LDVRLSFKLIEERCGAVSFKRGDSFYRNGKVFFDIYSVDVCEATVVGTEDFYVRVEKDQSGVVVATCSCPKLASFQKDCQHIAAVLIAIHNRQKNGFVQDEPAADVTNELLTLFSDRPKRSSGHQLHFENRKVLDVEFIFKPVALKNGENLFGIELKVGPVNVRDIREFLGFVRKGSPFSLSSLFTYDPQHFCFEKEADAFIHQLIQVVFDEKMFTDGMNYSTENHLLLIPPTSWDRLVPLLKQAPMVRLDNEGKFYEQLNISDETLPLQFELFEANGYRLRVNGLESLVIFQSYRAVLIKGKLLTLTQENCDLLLELKGLIKSAGGNEIPISERQLNVIYEKVLPGLKKLGTVRLSESVRQKFFQTPLVAKLYLDRLKNRLLVGLEFQYETWVINPLEEHDSPRSIIIRDEKKEAEILQLMEDGQFAKTDGGYFLQNEELEYEFLYHILPKLQKLVQVYATTAVRNRIFRESAPPKIRVKVHKERTNWLEFKFEMTGIADKEIRDLLQAIEEKRKYYRLRDGALFSLETREIEEIQRFLKAVPAQPEDWERGLNVPIVHGLRLLDSVADQEQTFEFEASFRGFLDDFYHSDRLDFPVPDNLATILRDYQVKGYKWLKTLASYGFGGILADDMGLGKTLQSITYVVSELPNIREQSLPVLIVCPASLMYNWLDELLKFSPEVQAIVIDGSKDEREKLRQDVNGVDVVITSYPLVRRDLKWFEQQNFYTVFFDEAQAFKNPLTQTARAVKRIKAIHRFALTGTPIENSIEELWAIFHVVFPELFQGLQEFSHLSRKQISRRIRPFLLRRLKEDVLNELPEKMEFVDSAELLPEQKKLYAAYLAKLREDTLKHLNKETLDKNRIKILAGLTRLRQICCHPRLFIDGYRGSSAKFQQLLQIIEEARLSGRRVLVFSQFTKMLGLIGQQLNERGYPFFYLDGSTPPEERVQICRRFNDGERDLFLISLKAGGTGLNLAGADTVVLYDLWWNPAVEEQAADRAHRIGQKNVVQVIKLVARGTIEEKMNELQEKKRMLVEEVIDPRQGASYRLTEDDIREILML
jgi:SNF2 family DNA or RNA helicase